METIISKDRKNELYAFVYSQMNALLSKDDNKISNMANFVALLKSNFDLFWVGFYLVESNQLVLGPFQGPVPLGLIKKH